MTIQVTGKHLETGEAFQSFVIERTRGVLEKYIGPEISGHVRVEKERVGFKTNCSIRLKTGLLVEAQGRGDDAYASAEAALVHLEKRVRRYKRRLKDHHTKEAVERTQFGAFVNDYTVRADDEADHVPPAQDVHAEDRQGHHNHAALNIDGVDEDLAEAFGEPTSGSDQQAVGAIEDAPVIVAETTRPVHEFSVREAVMQLDLTEDTVLVFRNAATGNVNVVYRRADGHIGWIDPMPRETRT
ncbi:MAG: ribosome hibernation-promoting factor, HPF/YfiA family [Hyphomicrobiaceae bacterium]